MGSKNAPVPACFGGDPRSITFCCHPGYNLTFSYKCQRANMLRRIGMSNDQFVLIKDEFAEKNCWEDSRVCFGSLSYCCMRRDGCPGGRDLVLFEKYGGNNSKVIRNGEKWDHVRMKYFSLKKELALILLRAAKNQNEVEPYVRDLEEELNK